MRANATAEGAESGRISRDTRHVGSAGGTHAGQLRQGCGLRDVVKVCGDSLRNASLPSQQRAPRWGMAATSGTYMLGPMSVWRSLTAKMRYDGAAWPPLATLARSSCGSIFVFVCGLEDIEWECAASTPLVLRQHTPTKGVAAAHSYVYADTHTALLLCVPRRARWSALTRLEAAKCRAAGEA